MNDILKMTDEEAAWYVLGEKYQYNRIPSVDAELSKYHPVCGNYWTIVGMIELIPGFIAGSGLSDGLDSFVHSDSPDHEDRIKAYVDFLNMIGAGEFAKVLAEAIEKCVPYNDAIPHREYVELTDKMWKSYYEQDKVVAKMGAYFKSLVANKNNYMSNIVPVHASSVYEHELQPSIMGDEKPQSFSMIQENASEYEQRKVTDEI